MCQPIEGRSGTIRTHDTAEGIGVVGKDFIEVELAVGIEIAFQQPRLIHAGIVQGA